MGGNGKHLLYNYYKNAIQNYYQDVRDVYRDFSVIFILKINELDLELIILLVFTVTHIIVMRKVAHMKKK